MEGAEEDCVLLRGPCLALEKVGRETPGRMEPINMKKYSQEAASREGIDKKMSREMFSAIRDRIRSMPGLITREIVLKIKGDFKNVSSATLAHYVIASRVHDDVFKLYMQGKLSVGVLEALSVLDPDTGKFLALEIIEKGYLPLHVQKAKSLVKQGVAKSWDEALKRARGDIEVTPTVPRSPGRRSEGPCEPRTFGELLKDILTSGTEWRLKVKAVIAMIPMVEKEAEASFMTFTKLCMLRDSLGEQYEFVDKTVGAVLDRMVSRKASRSGADFREIDYGQASGRGTPRIGPPPWEVHGPGQDVPDASGQGQG